MWAPVLLVASVPAGPGTTIYANLGDWIVWLSALGLIGLLLAARFARVAHGFGEG